MSKQAMSEHERITDDEAIGACERAAASNDLKAMAVAEPRRSAHERTADRLRYAAERIRKLKGGSMSRMPEEMTTQELIETLRTRARELRDGKPRAESTPFTSELLEVAADEIESHESHDGE